MQSIRVYITLSCLLLLVISGGQVNAEILVISVSPENKRFFPETVERTLRALKTTGYDIELVEYPRKRSLHMLMKGKIAMELGISSSGIPQDSGLIRIEPPILEMTISMATSTKTPEYCTAKEEDLAEMTMAGMLGSNIYEVYYAPKFTEAFWAPSYVNMFKMVISQRADVTFVALHTTDQIPREIKEQLIICGTHQTNITAYSFIHKNIEWAKEKIEAAYRDEFGDN